ncbi:PAS domain S-box protein [Haloarcula rubripromontorii]|uniref:histidine kinase n=1 Tax=Haloarcula rubripromontorii TaxID=1705562 RepID=A0A847U5E4_9EURY|nr:PAS domain S-box protein [Haloarcula rubripromontorii]NLV08219.1 PAS domain S-box protein [Haloarcula rubripromontorii]
MSSEPSPALEEPIRQRLYEIVSADELSLEDKQTKALALGRELLGVQNGHIERADKAAGIHEVVASVGGPATLFTPGETLDRATTYCRHTMDASSPLALINAPEEGWGDDPAYKEHGLACYLGAPIFVRGEPYGTVCFVDENPRTDSFETSEKAFVELIARLLGRELDATHYEADLADAYNRRSALVAAAPDAIFLIDADTAEITDINEAATSLTGYDGADLDGMAVFDLHPTTSRDQYYQLFESIGATGETTSTLPDGSQLELQTADSDRIPIELSAAAVELSDGRYIQSIVRDISERVQREQELDRKQELFAHSQRLASVGGWEYDCQTDDLYWTDEVRRIHGVDEDFTPTVEDALSLFHPDDRPKLEEAFGRAIKDCEPYDLELRIVTPDDELRWVRAQGRPCRNGETVRLRGTFQDITERREREEELRLRTRAMDEAGVGISIADSTEPDIPLVYVNDAFTDVTGYDRETAIGTNCRFLQGSGTDEASVDIIRAAIEQEETRTAELLNYRTDGTPFWNELTVTPVADSTGETTHFIGIQRDVTSRKRRERLIGVLNRVLRHNLRNDITVIAGLGEAIAQAADGEVATYAETVTETARDLMSVSEKAKTVETALRDSPSPRPLDIVEMVGQIVMELQEAHPEATIQCDLPDEQQAMATDRLEMVLVELTENALNAGASELTVAVVPPEDDGRVTVEVRDDGPGLPAMEVRVLKEASESPVDHASSFGLWMVNWLVTEMGGEVDVAAADGTTVTIALQQGHRDDVSRGGAVTKAALGDDPDSWDW